MQKFKRVVFFVSDGTGTSAKVLGSSLLTQFDGYEFVYLLRPFIDTTEKACALIQEINEVYNKTGVRPLVMATVISLEISPMFLQTSAIFFDFYNPFIDLLESVLNMKASRKTGQAHGIANERRHHNQINALEFTLRNDDGLRIHEYQLADVIVFGPSRCAKTPVCLHLAIEHGMCAANYPVVEDDLAYGILPSSLKPHRDRLFGLISDPIKLCQIRESRKPGSLYASYERCVKEVKSVERLCQSEGIEYANSSKSSIEEIAALIVRRLNNLVL